MAPRLSALILAAGFSSRMGQLKALLPLATEGQQTVLQRCVELFRQCGIDEVVVVTGHRHEEVGAMARGVGARVAHNPNFASGMYSSIRAGVHDLRDGTSGFFLLPVDIPLVRCGTIKRLADAFVRHSGHIFYPLFAGRRGHPPLLAAELIPLIKRERQPEGGLRTLLAEVEAARPAMVQEVQVADAHIHFDMDTPEDYLAARHALHRQEYPVSDECAAILDHIHPMTAKGLAHGQRVAEVAVALCNAVNRHGGKQLDADLCRASGLLHDLAKGHPEHEEEGARWLRQLGFARAAEIVAAHKDLDWRPGRAIGERELVHLADKLVRGSRMVDLSERFEEKLVLYGQDAEALRAIGERYQLAVGLAEAVAAEAGQPVAEILQTVGRPCSR